jgi:hypothetical protein
MLTTWRYLAATILILSTSAEIESSFVPYTHAYVDGPI